MIKKSLSVFLSVVLVPLAPGPNWVELKFRKIPPNRVEYVDNTVRIHVNKTSSPLLYDLRGLKTVSEFELEVEVHGESVKTTAATQFENDSFLRFGLIAEGKNRLRGLSRTFAADWIKKMFALAPPGKGIDKVYFFNLTTSQALVGKKRIHPLSEYLAEENIVWIEKPGRIKIKKKLDKPMSVAGLWLSSSGDNFGWKFDVTVHSIELR